MSWNTPVTQSAQVGRVSRPIFWILSAGLVLLCSCAAPPPPTFRVSADYRLQVVYLGPTVAISRRLSVLTNDTQAFFSLGRVEPPQPGSVPETVDPVDVGEHFVERVKGTIKRVGMSADGQWLLAESDDYDWEEHRPLTHITAIRLVTGEMYSAGDRVGLREALGGVDVSSTAKLDPVEYFFEREFISRLLRETERDIGSNRVQRVKSGRD